MNRNPIGTMRTRLTLEAPVDTTDDTGGVARSYASLAVLWGAVLPASASDRFVAERMEQTITHSVRLRFQAGLTAAMRLRSGARIFFIHGVENIGERSRFLLCHCEEIRP